jgi:divalent metal cation (Fe/Co/Zn/Cd) transporter
MLIWPALLLAPLLALAEQSIVYALATPTCQTQREAWLHGVPFGFVVLTLALTAMAWHEARRLRRDTLDADAGHVDTDARTLRRYFLARVAVWSGALSSLVIVALWLPQWVLSPCAS